MRQLSTLIDAFVTISNNVRIIVTLNNITMAQVKRVIIAGYDENIKSLVDRAKELQQGGADAKAEARGMYRVINIMELLKFQGNVHLDGMYGNQVNTVGELRSAMSELQDEDQICIESIDNETGDQIDLHLVKLDVVSGVELTDGSTVNEVRFCPVQNVQPKDGAVLIPVTDDPKVNLVVDAVIEDLKVDFQEGDYTVIEELLQMIPRKNLVGALRDEEQVKENLIDKAMSVLYGDDDPKYEGSNRAYLQSLDSEEIERKIQYNS